MNLLMWGLLATLAAMFVCRWREAGRKLEDAQRTLTPEYESCRRRHPSSRQIEPEVEASPWSRRGEQR